MGIATYTSPAWIEEITEHEINCPKCKFKMTVKDYFKKKKFKKGEHFITTAICYNGCLNEDAEPGDIKEYFFCAHDFNDLKNVHNKIIKKLR